jgi:putative sigma-54 modulation protein
MRLQVTARHDHVSDVVRRYAEDKLSKLDRRVHDLALVELTLSREHNPSIADDHAAEAVLHMKGPNIVVHESATTYEAAIDRLLDKLERQVERYRDKRVHETRRRAQHHGPPAPEGLIEIRSEPGEESAA